MSSPNPKLCISKNMVVVTMFIIVVAPLGATAQLSTTFYNSSCPSVFSAVKAVVQSAISNEPRMGASLIRLFFHDCFINGCDAGVLLADNATTGFQGEQSAAPNANSLRGFDVIDDIKTNVDNTCGSSDIVSCADILAIAARDSVVELGGPTYDVLVGRRDATTANFTAANGGTQLPAFFDDLQTIIDKFDAKNLSVTDMVALSGAHTLGQAQCVTFRDHIYNDTNIDANFASERRANCSQQAGSTDSNLAPLDTQSPNSFNNDYYVNLVNQTGLLHSDQELFNGGQTDTLVTTYSNDQNTFFTDFVNAMTKMGNLDPLTGTQGEIRSVCSRVN